MAGGERSDMAFRGSRFTLRSVLLIVAVILFVVAAFGFDVKGISMAWLGLAFFAGSFLFP
jgi:hypothetical protein